MTHSFKPFYTAAIFAVLLSVVYISCGKSKSTTVPTLVKKSKCDSITCANGGVCDTGSGACICPSGYEGTFCETETRFKFIGTWTVSEKGSTAQAAVYSLSLIPDTAINTLFIANLSNSFSSYVKAIVSGDTLIIPNQELLGKIVFGKGYIYSDTTGRYGSIISMQYEVIDTATQIVDDYGCYIADSSKPSMWYKNK